MIHTESAKSARMSITHLQRTLALGGAPSPMDPPRAMTVEEQKQMMRDGKTGRNVEMFRVEDLAFVMDAQITRQDGGGSLITMGALKMADQAVTSAEILEKATEVVENQLDKFNRTADRATAEAKKRVAQLNDYNNRLADALTNLNKTLGDERMRCALENADKLVVAMTLLDKLEKNGSLHKIMAAMK